jgi:hypothetical protein
MPTSQTKGTQKAETPFAVGCKTTENEIDASNCMHTVFRSVVLAIIVILTAVLVTVLIPGIVAYSGGVFYKSGLIQRLPLDTKLRYQIYEGEKDSLHTISESIDAALRDPAMKAKPSEIRELLDTKEKLELRLTALERKAPVVLVPFYPQPNQFLFTGPYAALGLLLLVFSSGTRAIASPRRVFTLIRLAIFIYIFYQTPLWIRNFVTTNEGRVIFAYPNIDIHLGSFIVQEFIIFGFSSLLAACWYVWSETAHKARQKAAEFKCGASAFDMALSEEVSDTYLRWTWHSLVLGLGFFFFTSFYWNVVHRYNDDRYLASAVLAHLLWGISWALLSMPLFWVWRAWHHLRLRVISELATTTDERVKAQSDSMLKLLTEFEPIGGVRASIGWVGATLSFVAPIVQAFFK